MTAATAAAPTLAPVLAPVLALVLASAACVLLMAAPRAGACELTDAASRRRGAGRASARGALRAIGPVALLAVGVGLAQDAPTSASLGIASPRLGLAVTVGACLLAALALRRRAAGRDAARRRAVAAGAACELLVGELTAGTPPTTALRRVAVAEPMLGAVAGAAAMSGDVPAALRRLALDSGVASWERVADAWEVSARSGAGLTGVLAQVAASERDATARRRLVQQEMAEAQATARLMAVLPWLLVGAGSLGGGGALTFLTGSWIGVGSAAVGCALATAGLFWLERIEREGIPS